MTNLTKINVFYSTHAVLVWFIQRILEKFSNYLAKTCLFFLSHTRFDAHHSAILTVLLTNTQLNRGGSRRSTAQSVKRMQKPKTDRTIRVTYRQRNADNREKVTVFSGAASIYSKRCIVSSFCSSNTPPTPGDFSDSVHADRPQMAA